MSADDIEAINVYFQSQNTKTPEAAKLKQSWIQWYNGLNFITKALDSTSEEAANRRNIFNAANLQPVNLTDAVDLTQDQKIDRQAAIAQSKDLSPAQKTAALKKNPTIPTTKGVPAGSVSHATIKQGSSGADVSAWQVVIGVNPDGKFGPGTANATKKWQKDHGLTADGVVGPKTWSAALGKTVQEAPSLISSFFPPVSPSFAPPKAAQAPLISPSPAVHAAAVAKNPIPQPPVKTLPVISSGTTVASMAMHTPKQKAVAAAIIAAPSTAGWFLGGPVGAVIGAGLGTLVEVFGIK